MAGKPAALDAAFRERREDDTRPFAMRNIPHFNGYLSRFRIPLMLLVAVAFGMTALVIAPGSVDAGKEKVTGKQEGYLGVTLQSLTDEIIEGLHLKVRRGVLVSEVLDDSPADEAGVEEGDVIIVYNGEKVDTPKELIKLVQKTSVGEKVKLKVARDEDTKTIVVTIGEKPEAFAFQVPGIKGMPDKMISILKPGVQLGVKIQDLENGDLAEYFGVEEGEGVLVIGVIDDSAAEEAGVKAGDVIIGLNDEEIESGEALIDEVQEMESGDAFELVVLRHGKK
ncbi:MAG: PDZ domain-containing protein, partial [Candidatus Latescibacterota bacterium]